VLQLQLTAPLTPSALTIVEDPTACEAAGGSPTFVGDSLCTLGTSAQRRRHCCLHTCRTLRCRTPRSTIRACPLICFVLCRWPTALSGVGEGGCLSLSSRSFRPSLQTTVDTFAEALLMVETAFSHATSFQRWFLWWRF